MDKHPSLLQNFVNYRKTFNNIYTLMHPITILFGIF